MASTFATRVVSSRAVLRGSLNSLTNSAIVVAHAVPRHTRGRGDFGEAVHVEVAVGKPPTESSESFRTRRGADCAGR